MRSAIDFRKALIAAVDAYPTQDTRLYHLLMARRCPPAMILRYAQSTYVSARLFCATIAEMVDKAPSERARLWLLENLLEEEGIVLKPSQGLVVRPEQRHPALAARFLRACGGNELDAEAHTRHATGPGRQLLADGRWTEAVAHLLVGQELKFGAASACLFDAFRANGYSAHDLAFFAVHRTADCEHGEQALQLVIEQCRTATEQDAALVAARNGTRIWFDMHGGAARMARSLEHV